MRAARRDDQYVGASARRMVLETLAPQRSAGGDAVDPRHGLRDLLRDSFSRAIVDVQGFYWDRVFVLKTLAVFRLPPGGIKQPREALRRDSVSLYTFRPPCSDSELSRRDRVTQRWLERQHHRTPWKSGSLDYATRFDVVREAMQGVQKIYVKGEQKCEWLRSYIDCEVLDMETLGCPPLRHCVTTLQALNSDAVSFVRDRAILQVLALVNWLSEQTYWLDEMKSDDPL